MAPRLSLEGVAISLSQKAGIRSGRACRNLGVKYVQGHSVGNHVSSHIAPGVQKISVL